MKNRAFVKSRNSGSASALFDASVVLPGLTLSGGRGGEPVAETTEFRHNPGVARSDCTRWTVIRDAADCDGVQMGGEDPE